MSTPNFLTDEGFRIIKATRKLHKTLLRERTSHLSELYTLCGSGLSTVQFEELVKNLDWCLISKGRLGASIVSFNEQPEVSENQPA